MSVPMKDSGVEWLGEVPAHWSVARLATAVREVARVGHQDLPVLSISIHDGISDDELDETERNRKVAHIEDRSKYKRVVPGDIAYNMMRAWQGAFGAVNVNGQVSPAYVVAAPIRPINASYVELLLRTPMAIEEMRRFSRGIADFRSRLYWEHFRDIRVCFPPIEEQDRIVSKVAKVTSRIDALVAKKTRFIELMREKIIALTTRVQADEKTRWMRLKSVADVVSRPIEQLNGENYTRLGLYNRGRGIFKKDSSDAEDMGDSSFHWVRDGDLIISGQFAWEGAVAMARNEHDGCVVSHRYPILRGREGEVLSEYLLAYFLTTHGDMVLNDCSRGSAGRNRPLNVGLLMNWKVPVPSMETQERIVSLMLKKEKAEGLQKKSVALLKEHRTALVTAAVTGKIDLRNAA